MPDEDDQPQYPDQPDDATVDRSEDQDGDEAVAAPDQVSASEAIADNEPTRDDDAGDDEEADPSERMPQPRPLPVAVRNSTVIGQLVISYPERDVTVLLDGDAAMRLMTMFAQRRERGLADVLDPEVSSALSGWVVLDVEEPLAMSWLPGLPSGRRRTAIDPAVAA